MGKNYLLKVSYLFGHAFSLTPKPPATRLLWHLIFDPGLDCGLETINLGQSRHLPITKTQLLSTVSLRDGALLRNVSNILHASPSPPVCNTSERQAALFCGGAALW